MELLVEDGEEMWDVMSQMPTGERAGKVALSSTCLCYFCHALLP